MSDAPAAGRLELDAYVQGIVAGDRSVLARAITLVESRLAGDREHAHALVRALLPRARGGHRIGISGPPGVGKSTLIEALGEHVLALGHRLAVLAVDPSSALSGGSIMGDKTRMPNLARNASAFIRPSPNRGVHGGVAAGTRATIVLCEAAGFDVTFVETVGVGQSEYEVANMVDFFLGLVQPGSGDELQGIKRGIMELVDMIAVTKSDLGDGTMAELTRAEYAHALHLMQPRVPGWSPVVTTCSAVSGHGIESLWTSIEHHRRVLEDNGQFEAQRRAQRRQWFGAALHDAVWWALERDPSLREQRERLELAVVDGTMVPEQAADELLASFRGMTR